MPISARRYHHGKLNALALRRAATSLIAAAAAIVGLADGTLRAQTLSDTLTGKRVRITLVQIANSNQVGGYAIDETSTRMPVMGTVVGFDRDTLRLILNGSGSTAIPLASIARFEVSTGRGVTGAHVGLGAVAGLLVGGFAGLFHGSAKDSGCKAGGFCLGLAAPAEGIVGAALGSALGAVIGALVPGERWEAATVPSRVILVPSSRGAVLAIHGIF
ncbi:MAG: hypothetical protein NVS4B3_15360 [Gemmatimonadaceae bacterium]